MINTLHEVLIFLEDRGRTALSDFKGWRSRQVRGALGRLEREGWVKKEKIAGVTYYELSASGQREIDETLSFLRTHDDVWDGVWRLVMFDIPEKERDVRDRFRRGLVQLNLRNLQGSVWVTSKDIREKVIELAKEVGVSTERLNVFTARAENDRNIVAAWKLDELNRDYRRFAQKVKKIFQARRRLNNFEIKKIIFDYSLLRRRDPNLPENLLPRQWAEDEAHKAYQKLRREIT